MKKLIISALLAAGADYAFHDGAYVRAIGASVHAFGTKSSTAINGSIFRR